MASRRSEDVLTLLKAAAAAGAGDQDALASSSYLVYAGAQWCPACARAQASPVFLQRLRDAPCVVYLSNDVGEEEAVAAAQRLPGTVFHRTGEAAQELMRCLNVTQIPTLVHVAKRADDGLEIQAMPVETDGDGDGKAAPPSEVATTLDDLFREGVRQHEAGEWTAALGTFAMVLELEPRRAGAAFNLAATLQMLGLTRLAVDYTSRTLALRPDDATAHALLGTVLVASERDAVVHAYRRLVASTTPPNPRAQHRLAVLTGEGPSATSAAPEYVSQVFDELADSFEEKLVEHLQYRVPWDLYEAVRALRPPPPPPAKGWRVLDLGMGTGLCGKQFQAYCRGLEGGAMVGCDLSPKMAAKAREGGAYTEVRVQDVHDALRQEAATPGSLDLVLSADTWIYVGKLDEAFALAARALCAGGLFAFSIEELLAAGSSKEAAPLPPPPPPPPPPPAAAAGVTEEFRLLASGRYAQSHAYILRLLEAHDFVVRTAKNIVVRNECTVPIPGRMYVAERRRREREEG